MLLSIWTLLVVFVYGPQVGKLKSEGRYDVMAISGAGVFMITVVFILLELLSLTTPSNIG